MSLGLRMLATLPETRPDAGPFLARLEEWLCTRYATMRPVTRIAQIGAVPGLLCKLHPAAENLEISLIEPRQLVASANTTTVGPGYHVFLTALLKDLAAETGAVWEPESEEYGDETGYFFDGDLDRLQTEMRSWLAALAGLFFNGALDSDSRGIPLCMPISPQFESTEAAITPLGPRDREWLRRTAADGSQGTEFFSWWQPGLDAAYYQRRALAQLWTDVRWRPSANEQEVSVLTDIADCLKMAYELDPSLEYPWAEWKQILEYLGTERPESVTVERQAHGTPLIGYRRNRILAGLTGGWSIRIPGSFTDFEVDEEGSLYAIDPPREVWFTAYRIEGETAKTFEARKTKMMNDHADRIIDRETYFAQANIRRVKRDSGEQYFVLDTSNLKIGAHSVCSILFSSADETGWAYDIWSSLEPSGPLKSGNRQD
jgi:hypothetical protein